jgi:hypothetical protein
VLLLRRQLVQQRSGSVLIISYRYERIAVDETISREAIDERKILKQNKADCSLRFLATVLRKRKP